MPFLEHVQVGARARLLRSAALRDRQVCVTDAAERLLVHGRDVRLAQSTCLERPLRLPLALTVADLLVDGPGARTRHSSQTLALAVPVAHERVVGFGWLKFVHMAFE